MTPKATGEGAEVRTIGETDSYLLMPTVRVTTSPGDVRLHRLLHRNSIGRGGLLCMDVLLQTLGCQRLGKIPSPLPRWSPKDSGHILRVDSTSTGHHQARTRHTLITHSHSRLFLPHHHSTQRPVKISIHLEPDRGRLLDLQDSEETPGARGSLLPLSMMPHVLLLLIQASTTRLARILLRHLHTTQAIRHHRTEARMPSRLLSPMPFRVRRRPH